LLAEDLLKKKSFSQRNVDCFVADAPRNDEFGEQPYFPITIIARRNEVPVPAEAGKQSIMLSFFNDTCCKGHGMT
jgi:hypothetical protein